MITNQTERTEDEWMKESDNKWKKYELKIKHKKGTKREQNNVKEPFKEI
jgi:hypothetical protein